jgi:hypothetical protein
MTAGGAEYPQMISDMKKMADLLQSRNYPGLKVETYVLPDENHLSGCPAGVMRALKVFYKR